MLPILDERLIRVVDAFLGPDTFLAFGFDGTLAPIVDRPDEAAVGRFTQLLLSRIAHHYMTAIVGGRTRYDMLRRIGEIPLAAVVGNHGLDTGFEETHAGHSFAQQRATAMGWRHQLWSRLKFVPGIEIEYKDISLSIHHRRCNSLNALRAIREAARELQGAKLFAGKMTLNVVPSDAPSKALVLSALARRFEAGRCIYIGDDESDEPIFEESFPFPLLGVRVGRLRTSAAHYFLDTQDDINDFLCLVASNRTHKNAAQRL